MAPLVVFLGVLLMAEVDQSDAITAIRFQGEDYVAVHSLPQVLGTDAAIKQAARDVTVRVGDKSWAFQNGGDTLRLPDGKTVTLRSPLLLLDGVPYLSLAECQTLLGYRIVAGDIESLGGNASRPLRFEDLTPSFLRHQVRDIRIIHESLETTSPISAMKSLHLDEAAQEIPAGTRLLARRQANVNGRAYLAVVDARNLQDYLIVEADARARSRPTTLARTNWDNLYRQCSEEAQQGLGLRRARDTPKHHVVYLTIDMCWSLRAVEWRLFENLASEAHQKPTAAVVFLSGRWIKQHPEDMQRLLEFGRKPGLNLIMAEHSYLHPKDQPFLNRWTREEICEDTLTLERQLLSWGCPPSIFYRFPGLVHDPKRIEAVLSLDLLPIDCESWLAHINQPEKIPPIGGHRFTRPISPGSILLVHGNGNEPLGVDEWVIWRREHPDWVLGNLSDGLLGP